MRARKGAREMAKFKTVVKRSEWLRGDDGTLLDVDGMKCCLGFRCEQQGVPQAALRPNLMPSGISDAFKISGWLREIDENSPVGKASAINDSGAIKDAEREAKLKEIFASQDEEIEFVD